VGHWLDLIAMFSPTQVEAWFEWGGYFILFGLLFACGLGLPMPEDIPLLIAGYFIAQGKMHWAHAGIVAWLGIIGGDCVLYMLGRRFGLEITRVPFIGKHVTKERILRAEELFNRWGTWVVAIGRLIAGIRGAMVVAAGAIRFNFVKFIIVDGLAAIVSGGLFVSLGYWAGKKLGSIAEMRAKIKGVEHWVFLGIGLIVAAVVFFYWWRAKKHKPKIADVALQKAAERAAEHPPAKALQSANPSAEELSLIPPPEAPVPAPLTDPPPPATDSTSKSSTDSQR
jgi:membrane protein DedA with SNARE-associated domain